ncbi:MAG: MBL fold metallo-hydrolase [Gemmatimonadaceae bacterium]|nr:MBL fold metallo-hydrolase [Gemmatimonadaceae bacterium]
MRRAEGILGAIVTRAARGGGACVLLLAAVLAPDSLAAQGRSTTRPPARTRVVILGTGNPNADPERSGPAVAVVVDDRAYLVDAGPGVVRRAAAAARAGTGALAAERLDLVFLSHLHSDHTVGLTDLIFTPWVLERPGPLRVFGPRGVREMTDHLVAAFAEDIAVRIEGREHANREGYKVRATVVTPGIVYKDDKVTVKAFAVPHGDWKEAFGYRFETPDRVIVISGDTKASRAVVDACNGCDLLVHEVYSTERFATRPARWQEYHRNAHTSTVELARLAIEARAKSLVLYHQLYWGATDDDLLREVRGAGYRGPLASAHDLGVY